MEHYLVLYNFNAEEEGELTVEAGDIVCKVHHQTPSNQEDDNGWVLVEIVSKNNKSHHSPVIGFVPRSYIKKDSRYAAETTDAISTPSLGDGDYEKSLVKQFTNEQKSHVADSNPGSGNTSVFTAEHLLKILPKRVDAAVPMIMKPTQLDAFPSAGSISPSFSISSKTSSRHKTDTSVFNPTALITPTTQSIHHTVKNNAASQVPRLSLLIEKEEFGEVLNASEAFFEKLLLNERENLSAFMKSLEDISGSVKESMNSNNELIKDLSSLADLIEKEKTIIKQQMNEERNADLLNNKGKFTLYSSSSSNNSADRNLI